MDSRVKYGVLIVVGGVGVYLIWKGGYLAQWFPSLFGPGAPLATAPVTTPTGVTPAQVAAIMAQQPSSLPAISAPTAPVPAPTPTTPVSVPSTPASPVNPAPAATQLISQKMTALAGTSTGLGMDQWCYFYTAATGQDCPFDPGSIDPQTYQDAGILAADGSAGDRSTPTDIGTWLAMAQLQAPQLGLTGIEGLAALHVANAWLV